ncbi:MAG: phosphoethanolamine transferase [Paludibacteraceae bacterium]|nr:phosphoethanolamine transferase [Paludibacteraceae bacterium]
MDMKTKDLLLRSTSLLLLALILLYPNVMYCIANNSGISYIVTGIIFLLPIVALVALIPQRWLYCVIASLLTVVSIADLTMVDLYKDYLLAGGIISTIKTNPQEAYEFYHTNLGEVLHWIPLIALCVASCFLYRKPVSFRNTLVGIAFAFLIPAAFITYKLHVFYHNNPLTLRYYMDNRVWNRPPYNIYYQSWNAYIDLQRRKRRTEPQSMGAYRSLQTDKQEIYVFAIGESLRYDNISLNGKYHRSTTPRLESLQNLVLYDDYYSQACLTMYSVPQLVSRATPENFELNYVERSIVEPFRECGFKVFTVVSQTNLLSYEKYLSDGVDSLIIVPNIVKDGEILSGDKTIVHIIDSLAQQHNKLFVMTQFMGNHSFFTNYEKEFEWYNPNSNNCPASQIRDSMMLINAYDNSILYTDYILSSIIEKINRPDAISAFMFVSDHGESIGNGGAGHGGNCAATLQEYHVPYIFWWSDEYERTFPDKIANAKQRMSARLNGDNIFYCLCDAADIELAEQYAKPQWSILSPSFEEHERLILVPDGKTCVHVDK